MSRDKKGQLSRVRLQNPKMVDCYAKLGTVLKRRRESLGIGLTELAVDAASWPMEILGMEEGRTQITWMYLNRIAPFYKLRVDVAPAETEADYLAATAIARLFNWGSPEDFLMGVEAIMRGFRYARRHPEVGVPVKEDQP